MSTLRGLFRGLALAAAVVVLTSAGAAWGQGLVTRPADGFTAQGSSPIAGWTWLRVEGDMAEWRWNAVAGQPTEACINFDLLVTNGGNGGSGYSATVRAFVIDHTGHVADQRRLLLRNTFLPRYDGDSAGVGYPASGSFCSRDLATLLGQGFSIRIVWPPAGNRYHVAVQPGKAVLAFVDDSGRPRS